MESTCPSCQLLVSQGRPHPHLHTLSTLKDSQLFKCRCCNSYLHRDQSGWEVLSAGHYQDEAPTATGGRALKTA
ncbi:hypothetical protein [Marinobacterium aestuariivivens]|uniref:Uncharacterized protein n=1 Tax=Marinobacterium aestuariivivens TaxID=1698799 RepID=A0ABW2A8L9_9GAMM